MAFIRRLPVPIVCPSSGVEKTRKEEEEDEEDDDDRARSSPPPPPLPLPVRAPDVWPPPLSTVVCSTASTHVARGDGRSREDARDGVGCVLHEREEPEHTVVEEEEDGNEAEGEEVWDAAGEGEWACRTAWPSWGDVPSGTELKCREFFFIFWVLVVVGGGGMRSRVRFCTASPPVLVVFLVRRMAWRFCVCNHC